MVRRRPFTSSLKGLIPNADRMRISSRSRDGNSMVIYNRGPRDPGTYYLVKNGTVLCALALKNRNFPVINLLM